MIPGINHEYSVFFEKLFDSSPEGVVIQGLDGTVLKANRAFCEMFGYSLAEIIGSELDTLVGKDPEVHDEASSYTGKSVLGEEFTFESVRQRKDGSRFHVTAFGIPISKEGKVVAVYGMYRDITDRKDAEEAVRRSEERYRAIVNQQQELIVRFSPDWRVSFANEAYCKFYGVSADKVIGTPILDHVPVDKREITINHLKSLGRENRTRTSEEETQLPSGEIRCLQWADTVLIDNDGNITEYQSVGRDITDRKAMEESLLLSGEKLEKLLDDTVKLLAGTMRIRDVYTADHQENVARLVKAIAEEMGLSEDRSKGLWVAGMIHDIGKLHIPGEILNKPTSLSTIEFEIVKRHAEVGAETLRGVSFPWPIANIIAQHHERLDGSGYPRGLRKKQIIEDALILSVADVVEAMCSHRPFRPAYGLETALETIRDGAGTLFGERPVECCCRVFEKGFLFLK
ncbi:MAG: PAS domain S-box protein [Thermovirgaceae bacterium]|nr:PAS domain S-box protein [Thermovirgaceae bacterium]